MLCAWVCVLSSSVSLRLCVRVSAFDRVVAAETLTYVMRLSIYLIAPAAGPYWSYPEQVCVCVCVCVCVRTCVSNVFVGLCLCGVGLFVL